MLHPLRLPLSSCLGCIPPLIGLPSLRFMRLALVCFYCLCVFVYVLYFIATMSFAGYFLSVLFCLLSMLISDSRFDLVWFRLSCDHGWIRSGSVNVRKQQQQHNDSFAALSAGGVSGSALYQSAPCQTVVSPKRLPQADSSSLSKLFSLLKMEVIFQGDPNYQENTKHGNLQSMPSSAPETID